MEQNTSKNLKEIASMMGFSPTTVKKWIKDNVPGIYKRKKRKSFFTPKEVKKIMNEFN
ncbi:MAG: helix-turn-helix domain-containing protein [bacterium]|nr:helix-turn-helix domain-containing protein [bacterium]